MCFRDSLPDDGAQVLKLIDNGRADEVRRQSFSSVLIAIGGIGFVERDLQLFPVFEGM